MQTAPENKGVLVTGLGRCGSSMVCQMFHAGGAEVAGEYPSFETPESFSADWVVEQLSAGRVVKVLDPHRYDLPALDTNVIWLDRNPKQQARSIIKLGIAFGQVSRRVTGKDYGNMRKILERDRLKAMRHLKQVCQVRPVVYKFENILSSPFLAAMAMYEQSGMYHLKVKDMAGALLDRSPECLPNLLEVEQYIRGQNAQGKRQ